ncbi:DUF805 domain-containing protein [Novosphingobium sp. BL-8A]|uniref:DUF805 domain-containing protein n=1 Tax=Novosphingobium sp. BL-8A TaxID=3127639 RepID=UPI0037574B6A
MKNLLNTWRRLAAQTLRRTFTTSGRAARSELIAWFVLVLLANIVLGGIASLAVSGAQLEWARLAIALVAVVPGVALLARRMHDIGFRGWWSLPIVLVAIQNVALDVIARTAGWEARAAIEAITRYLDWLLFPAFGLAYLLLLLAPGTKGANGYGPDPRAVPDLRNASENAPKMA